jgi:hypothetical protein
MAGKNEPAAKAASPVTAPEAAPPAAAPAPEPAVVAPTKFWAHGDIIHDGCVIKKGEELPEKFPVDSAAHLLRSKVIGKTPPAGPSVVTRGEAPTLAAQPAAEPAAEPTATPSPATDGTPA